MIRDTVKMCPHTATSVTGTRRSMGGFYMFTYMKTYKNQPYIVGKYTIPGWWMEFLISRIEEIWQVIYRYSCRHKLQVS